LIRNFKIVKVDYKYCDYLRMFDSKVSYNSSSKELRPFVGILFIVNGCEYFAPLSSPKIKHIHMKNNVDVVKIDNGNYGVVNFNNMIPVTSNNYELIDLNAAPKNTNELKMYNLLKTQLLWLNRNNKDVKGKAIKLYEMYKNENGGLAIHSNKVTQYSIDGRLVETTLWNEDDSSVYTSFNQDGSKDVIKRDASGNETSKEHIEKDHNNMSFIVNDNVNASALTITVSSNKGR